MAIVKWNRWGVPAVFDEDNWLSQWFDTGTSTGLDVYETNDAIVVEAQVPGIKEENIEINIDGNVLTINATQKETEEQKDKKKTVYKSTRQTSFSYSTNLPRIVDPSKAEAEVEQGVLKITIPKSEEDKPKKIEVKKKTK
ncbi:MAG TPA: Hsp20/alpha crystallin family protein [bacterium]|jgi:HSP20 family molecular chaperone IbpA|nr:Hsp20/alpha crystallin family protein [bacterium]